MSPGPRPTDGPPAPGDVIRTERVFSVFILIIL